MFLSLDKVGDIMAFGKDAAHLASMVQNWLVDEVQIAPFERALCGASQVDLSGCGDVRHAGRIDLIEKFEEGLTFEIGETARTERP